MLKYFIDKASKSPKDAKAMFSICIALIIIGTVILVAISWLCKLMGSMQIHALNFST